MRAADADVAALRAAQARWSALARKVSKTLDTEKAQPADGLGGLMIVAAGCIMALEDCGISGGRAAALSALDAALTGMAPGDGDTHCQVTRQPGGRAEAVAVGRAIAPLMDAGEVNEALSVLATTIATTIASCDDESDRARALSDIMGQLPAAVGSHRAAILKNRAFDDAAAMHDPGTA